jgi:ribosomal protein L13E
MRGVKPEILKPNGKKRSGRGFSLNELKKAGVEAAEAARLGIPVDLRRTTTHDENVDSVKAFAKVARAKVKHKPKPSSSVEKEKSKS